MSDPVRVRHRVMLAGVVVDGGTLAPLGSVNVQMTAMPPAAQAEVVLFQSIHGAQWAKLTERVDRTQTREDGLFYFFDLPDGKYTVEASMLTKGTRYGRATQKYTVSQGQSETNKLQLISVPLPVTLVSGKVLLKGSSATPISLATVRVQGSDERAFSDDSGAFILHGLEPGARVLHASAQGFNSASLGIVVKPYEAIDAIEFSLGRST